MKVCAGQTGHGATSFGRMFNWARVDSFSSISAAVDDLRREYRLIASMTRNKTLWNSVNVECASIVEVDFGKNDAVLRSL